MALRSNGCCGANDIPERNLRSKLAKALRRVFRREAGVERLRRLFEATARIPILDRPASSLKVALQARLQPQLAPEEVLGILRLLEDHGVSAILAGGWGVDALVGRLSRFHRDLDLVVESLCLDVEWEKVRQVMASSGYHFVEDFDGGLWMPKVAVFKDPAGRKVELMSLDWHQITEHSGHRGDGSVLESPWLGSVGTVVGSPVRCLSAEAQELFHSGYTLRAKDREQLRRIARLSGGPQRFSRLRAGIGHLVGLTAPKALAQRIRYRPAIRSSAAEGPSAAGAASALIIPMGELRGQLGRLGNLAMAGAPGLPPHISVLYPFLSGGEVKDQDRRLLESVIGGFPRVMINFKALRWFRKEVLWLEPSPAVPLRKLTEAIVESFPECKPYGGEFDEIVPHLTVAERKPRPRMLLAQALVRRRLPLVATAGAVWWMAQDPTGSWHRVATFELGAGE